MKLEDVAKKAGVGKATVSRVLNGQPGVKKSTQTKILRAMEELNYHPNLHASTLAKGKSHTLGIILSNLYNPFFSDVLHAIEECALHDGYEILVANTRHDLDLLRKSIRRMLGGRVAGLAAIVSESNETILRELEYSKTPIVLYDTGRPGPNITTIQCDYRKGMRMLIELLHNLGHQRLAYVAAPFALRPTESRRCEFLEATARHSLCAHVVVPSLDGFAGGRESARELMESGFAPTAILCVNDWIAVGVLRELQSRGISVPRDISVTGFDNNSIAEFTCPSLTTVHVPRESIGRLVFEHLHGRATSSGRPGQDIVVYPELVVRESTAMAPVLAKKPKKE